MILILVQYDVKNLQFTGEGGLYLVQAAIILVTQSVIIIQVCFSD